MFGLIGRHPLAILVVDVALVALAAVLLDVLLRRLGVEDRLALAAAALWIVVPNHTSMLHWATATPITLALVLLLLGGLALTHERDAAAAFLFGASALTYEATAPAAVALVIAVPLMQRRPWRSAVAWGAAVLVPCGAWVALHVPSEKDAGLSRWADLSLVPQAHLGWGVFPDGPAATVLGLTALVLVALWCRREPLIVAGLVVIGLGTIPFVRYFYEPLGAGDRVNVVAAVGTALLWVGLLSRFPRAVGFGVVAVMAVAGWQRSMAWADAADDARDVLASLPPSPVHETLRLDRTPVRQNVTAFADRSNIEGAVQLQCDRRDVAVRLRPAR